MMRGDPQWLERLRAIQNTEEADLPSLEEAQLINDRHLILRTCREAIQHTRDEAVRVKACDLLARMRGFYP